MGIECPKSCETLQEEGLMLREIGTFITPFLSQKFLSSCHAPSYLSIPCGSSSSDPKEKFQLNCAEFYFGTAPDRNRGADVLRG